MPLSSVHLQDCLVAMRGHADKTFDLAIVDPPYGININMNMGRRKGERQRHEVKNWDDAPPDQEYFNELFRVSKNQIIWGGNYFPLPLTKAWLFWDKMVPDGVDFADGELAWTSFDKTLRKVKLQYSGFRGLDPGGKMHPTQKPIALYRWLLNRYAKPGDLILDTHLGSGSHRIAAWQMGLDFVGYEIDPAYHAAQEKRFKNSILQISLFQEAPNGG